MLSLALVHAPLRSSSPALYNRRLVSSAVPRASRCRFVRTVMRSLWVSITMLTLVEHQENILSYNRDIFESGHGPFTRSQPAAQRSLRTADRVATLAPTPAHTLNHGSAGSQTLALQTQRNTL